MKESIIYPGSHTAEYTLAQSSNSIWFRRLIGFNVIMDILEYFQFLLLKAYKRDDDDDDDDDSGKAEDDGDDDDDDGGESRWILSTV